MQKPSFKKWSRLYDPQSKEAFKISRSKIDLFVNCPRCFYLDQRLGVKRPDMPAFSLNNAVDTLLKKEFDINRAAKTAHPLMKAYKVDAVPFAHSDLEAWRDALRRGISFLHKPTNLLIRGGIDDIWVNPKGEVMIVDYKATSKEKAPDLEGQYQQAYKRQMEVYQWLFRQNGFKVYPVAYFVYVNGKSDRKAFDGKLEFDVLLIPYTGSDEWIEPTLVEIKKTLELPAPPAANSECEYCRYVEARAVAVGGKKPASAPKAVKNKKALVSNSNEALF